jgi:hypothetical protein
MATQTIEFRSPPSQTVTLRLFVQGSDTQVASASATEATNRKGTYTAVFSSIAAGEYQLIATIGTSPIIPVASGFVTLTLTTATFFSYSKVELITAPPTAAANASAVRTELATELGRIDANISSRSTYAGGAVASVTNPVTVGTNSDKTGYSLTSGERGAIADAVWDEDNRDHLSAHSTGKNLDTIRKSNLLVEGTILASPAPTTTAFNVSGVNYPTGAFKHSILSFAEDATIANQNSPILTYVNNGNGTSTITIEEALTTAPVAGDKIQIDPNSHVHAIAAIVSGVWSALVGGYSAATGTMGLVVYALSTMIEFVSSVWRWKSTALSQAPSGGGGEGDYAITLVATSTGGAVPATKFSIVGTSTVVYANSLGVAVVNLDADTYTLRTTPPPGYQPVADSPLVVAADATVTKTLIAIPAPTPPSPSQCLLSVYVAKQSGSPFESVTVTARFPAGWSVASGTMAVNAVIEDVTDSTGLAQLMLYREQEYDLSFVRQNGTIAKIRITTPNAASASLSQVYSP